MLFFSFTRLGPETCFVIPIRPHKFSSVLIGREKRDYKAKKSS
jgi:hypothetical protein